MSVKDRMAKMKGILAPVADKQDPQTSTQSEAPNQIAPKSGPQTAPGGMLAFRSQLQQHEATVRSL